MNAIDFGLTSTDMKGNGTGHSLEEGARRALALARTNAYESKGFYACASSGELAKSVGDICLEILRDTP